MMQRVLVLFLIIFIIASSVLVSTSNSEVTSSEELIWDDSSSSSEDLESRCQNVMDTFRKIAQREKSMEILLELDSTLMELLVTTLHYPEVKEHIQKNSNKKLIKDLLPLLEHPDLEIQEAGLQIFHHIADGSHQSVDSLIESGILKHIKRLLADEILVFKSLRLAITVILKSQKYSKKIDESGIADAIVPLFRQDNDLVLNILVLTISHVSWNNNGTYHCPFYNKIMPNLELLLHHHDKEIVFAASAAVVGLTERKAENCVYNQDRQEIILKSLATLLNENDDKIRTFAFKGILNNAVTVLEQAGIVLESAFTKFVETYLQKDHPEALVQAAEAFVQVFQKQMDKDIEGSLAIQSLMNFSLIKTIVTFLGDPEWKMRNNALITAVGIVDIDGEKVTAFIKSGVLKNMNALLLDSNKMTQRFAIIFLGNVLTRKEYIDIIFIEGFISKIIDFLEDENDGIQKEATFAINNVILHGNEDQLDLLVELGFIPPFCHRLSSEDSQIVLNSLFNLLKIIEKQKFCEEIAESEKCQNSLQQFQNHENGLFRYYSSAILHNCASQNVHDSEEL